MAKLPETPHPNVTDIITGNFRQKTGYFAYRSNGVDDWLIIYTASGLGRFGYGTHGETVGEIIARPGDIVLLRPRTLHDYGVESTLSQWDLLWAHFQPRPSWRDLLAWPAAKEGHPGLMRLTLSDEPSRKRIHERLLDMHRLATRPARQRVELAMNALEEVLLWCDANNPRTQTLVDSRIAETMDYVCADLSRPADVPELAERAGLSESRFAHLFRQQIGLPPQQWVELQRINRARQLLELTNMPVKQIAGLVGFGNPLYFTLRFTKQMKKSPREFRKSRLEITPAPSP